EVMEIPLLPVVEDLSGIGERREFQKRRALPTILGIYHRRVIAVKPVVAKAAERIGPTEGRLQIERNALSVARGGQRGSAMERDHSRAVEQRDVLGSVQIEPKEAVSAEIPIEVADVLRRVLAAARRTGSVIAPIVLDHASAAPEVGLPVDAG